MFGSLAAGDATEESDVDLMVIGQVGLRDVAPLVSKIGSALGREVNPVTISPQEWAERLAQSDHFIGNVARGPKLFIVGDASELE